MDSAWSTADFPYFWQTLVSRYGREHAPFHHERRLVNITNSCSGGRPTRRRCGERLGNNQGGDVPALHAPAR